LWLGSSRACNMERTTGTKSWNILGEGLRLDHHLRRMPSKFSKKVSDNNKTVLRHGMFYREKCSNNRTKGSSLGQLVNFKVAENKTANSLSVQMRSRHTVVDSRKQSHAPFSCAAASSVSDAGTGACRTTAFGNI